jgi:hypothetical protein
MYVSSSSFSVVLSLPEIMFIKLFVARPTALEVFLAAPTTTGCRDISGKFALSSIMAVSEQAIIRPTVEDRQDCSDSQSVYLGIGMMQPL